MGLMIMYRTCDSNRHEIKYALAKTALGIYQEQKSFDNSLCEDI